jgi:exopolysaccharide production protein ExoZ
MIKPIQYLRAIAALMVVVFHGLWELPDQYGKVLGSYPLGGMGVELFFLISGFIMAVTALKGDVSPKQFMIKRAIRIVPLYWGVTLAVSAISVVAPTVFRTFKFSEGALVKSLLFIPQYSITSPDHIWPLIIPGWTLNYEMFFYGIFAMVLFLPKIYRLAALIVTMVWLVVVGVITGPFTDAVLITYTDPMLIEFAAGVIIGYLFMTDRIPKSVLASALMVAVGAGILSVRFDLAMSIPACCLIIIGVLNPAFRDYKSSLFLLLGDASYSIYLVHLFSLGLLRTIWSKLFPHIGALSAVAFMVAAVVVSAAVGVAVHRLIERPLTKWIGKRRLVIRIEVLEGAK